MRSGASFQEEHVLRPAGKPSKDEIWGKNQKMRTATNNSKPKLNSSSKQMKSQSLNGQGQIKAKILVASCLCHSFQILRMKRSIQHATEDLPYNCRKKLRPRWRPVILCWWSKRSVDAVLKQWDERPSAPCGCKCYLSRTGLAGKRKCYNVNSFL